MNFIGNAKKLDDIDLVMIGREIGVGEDEIHAILDVEAASSGFDKQKRPKMLFEPHVFWQQLGPGENRGFIIGPIIVSLFMALGEIYSIEFKGQLAEYNND